LVSSSLMVGKPAPGRAPQQVTPDNLSRLINLAGRQRMLSQRLVLFAVLARQGRADALRTARDTLKQLSDSHRLLVEGGDGLPGLFSAGLKQVFTSGDKAHARVQDFLALADRALTEMSRLDQPDGEGALPNLIDAASQILGVLNLVTQAYENEAHQLAQVQHKQRTRLIEDIQAVSREAKVVAFNAQVAAHRAGEAGREFAVVATRMSTITDEVDALAREALKAR
jgi:methyl-accepting chemotaxis protein